MNAEPRPLAVTPTVSLTVSRAEFFHHLRRLTVMWPPSGNRYSEEQFSRAMDYERHVALLCSGHPNGATP